MNWTKFAGVYTLLVIVGALLSSWVSVYIILKIIEALDVYIQSGGC